MTNLTHKNCPPCEKPRALYPFFSLGSDATFSQTCLICQQIKHSWFQTMYYNWSMWIKFKKANIQNHNFETVITVYMYAHMTKYKA